MPRGHFERPSPESRFWSRVDKNGSLPPHMPHLGPCWVWVGGTFSSGYGSFWLSGRSSHAHRVAWELTYGKIPDGLFVLHCCDRPLCVRPEHLFIGTHADNVRDRDEKGRQARGDRSGARLHPETRSRGRRHSIIMRRVAARGDRNAARLYPERTPRGELVGTSKLTANGVRRIRRLSEQGLSQCEIAKHTSVCRSQVGNILRGESWRHVT